jgi:hypothetical protein
MNVLLGQNSPTLQPISGGMVTLLEFLIDAKLFVTLTPCSDSFITRSPLTSAAYRFLSAKKTRFSLTAARK